MLWHRETAVKMGKVLFQNEIRRGMMTMKSSVRLVALWLVTCIVASLFPVGALAEGSTLTCQTYSKKVEGSEFSAQLNEGALNRIDLPIYGGIQVVFCLDGERITPTSVTVTGADSASVTVEEDPDLPDQGYYLVRAGGDVGNANLTVMSDDESYTFPVSVNVPENGLSSSTVLNQDTYLNGFTYTDTSSAFYYVCSQKINESTISVQINGQSLSDSTEGLVSYSLMEDGKVIQFVVDPSASSDMFLQLQFRPEGQDSGDWFDGITLTNGKSRLETTSLCFEDNGSVSLQDPESWWPQDFSYSSLGTRQTVVLRYGSEGEDYSYVTALQSANPEILAVSHRGTVTVGTTQVPVFDLESKAVGATTLICTLGGDPSNLIEIPVTISLPECGAFTSQNRSKETFVSEVSYYDLEQKELWFLKEGGFTEAEKDQLQVMQSENAPVDSTWISWVKHSTNPPTYDLKITLPQPSEDLNRLNLNLVQENRNFLVWASVDYMPRTGGVYVDVGGKQYLVGISMDPDTPGAFEINEENRGMGCDTQGEANPSNPRQSFRKIQVVAGEKIIDTQGGVYYKQASSRVVKLEVTDMTLEHLWGDEETFSWSQSKDRVSRITSGFSEDTWATLYFKEGYVGSDLVKVTVEITAGGSTTTETVSVQVSTWKYEPTIIDCTNCETVKEINQQLQKEWPTDNSQDEVKLCLKPEHTYAGTIELPEAKGGNSATNFAIEGNYTMLKGGIDLNGNTIGGIYAIHFLGDKLGTSAVFGGSTSVLNSTFQGYKLALDGSQGTVNPVNCVFVDNTVAARVDIANVTNGINANYWQNNIFLENETAVQVSSLNAVLSSYYFRVYNSNFIDNKTDFDVSCGGTLYFYKNYFGKKVKDAPSDSRTFLNQLTSAIDGGSSQLKDLVTSIAPKVNKDNKSKVVTNPRWKEPVGNGVPSLPETAGVTTAQTFAAPAALNETESANYLTADWELPTQIVNEDAADLVLSGNAFGDVTSDAKVIRVDDDQGQEIGSWTFQKRQTGLSGTFNAGLDIREDEEKIAVTVQGGAVVETLQPTLTIPCEFTAMVTCDGKKLAVTNTQDEVTFPVASGGTYVIEKASTTQTPSGGGSGQQAQPSKPSTSDGKTTVTAQVTPSITGDTAKVQISADVMDSAVEQVLQTAQAEGTAPAVEVQVNSGTAAGMEVTLPSKALGQLGESASASFTVKSGKVSITLDSQALAAAAENASGTVTLAVAPVEQEELNPQQQATAEDSPVYELSLSRGGQKISNLGSGNVLVSLPYQLKEGQKAQRVAIWKMDSEGGVTPLEAAYDAASGMVSFQTSELAACVIAYEPFADVKGNAWYFKSVDYMYDYGIMAGTSQTEDTFEPQSRLTRAQAVQILYNLERKPQVETQAAFTDLPQDWSTDAISWAAENKVTAGFEDHSFRPEKNVSREEFAQMLYNYADYKGIELSGGKDLSEFPDCGNVSDWAKAAMSWANGNQLINGHDDGRLDSRGTAIRAQAASILMRFDRDIVQN
jgi:hypothetical protein